MPAKPLGRLPSPDDPRDFQIRSLIRVDALAPTLPPKFHLRSFDRLKRFDQKENSCVGQSSALAKIVQERRDMHHTYGIDPLWIWDRAKEADGIGDPTADRGTYIRTALEVLRTQGAALTREAAADARFKIASYWRCATIDDVKAAIFAFGPVLLGSEWFDSWFSPGTDGMLPQPDQSAGGHAFVGYGWDDTVPVPWDGTHGALVCANSWGTAWGAGGDFVLPYSLFGDDKPTNEGWKAVDLIT